LARDPNAPTRLYAGSFGYGVFRSTDGGASWQAPVSGDEIFVAGIAVDPANSQLLLAAADGDKAIRSTDGGAHWTTSDSGLAGSRFYAIVAAGSPATLYIAGDEDTSAPVHGGGVFVSHDHGATWQPRNTGLSEHNVYALAVDPGNASCYAGTLNGIFKTATRHRTGRRHRRPPAQAKSTSSRRTFSRDHLCQCQRKGVFKSATAARTESCGRASRLPSQVDLGGGNTAVSSMSRHTGAVSPEGRRRRARSP
jgi:hypothetical protein